MSTIAFKNGVLVADTNCYTVPQHYYEKIRRAGDGSLIGIVGNLSAFAPLAVWVNNGHKLEDWPAIDDDYDFF